MDAAGARVAADAGADTGGELAIPRGCETDAGGVGGGGEAGVGTCAEGAVGHFKRGELERRQGANGEAGAADVVKLFGEGHLSDDVVDVLFFGRCEGVRGLGVESCAGEESGEEGE